MKKKIMEGAQNVRLFSFNGLFLHSIFQSFETKKITYLQPKWELLINVEVVTALHDRL